METPSQHALVYSQALEVVGHAVGILLVCLKHNKQNTHFDVRLTENSFSMLPILTESGSTDSLLG